MVAGVSWGVTLGLVHAAARGPRERDGARRGHRRHTARDGLDDARHGPAVPGAVAGVRRRRARRRTRWRLAAAYARLLADPDLHVREDAARRWCAWEDTHVSLMPGWAPDPRYEDAIFARLVTHCWSHGCFLADGQLFDHVDRLAGIPAVLVHGRYDVSGPLETSWRLQRAWPQSRLVILDDAGRGGGLHGRARGRPRLGVRARARESGVLPG